MVWTADPRYDHLFRSLVLNQLTIYFEGGFENQFLVHNVACIGLIFLVEKWYIIKCYFYASLGRFAGILATPSRGGAGGTTTFLASATFGARGARIF